MAVVALGAADAGQLELPDVESSDARSEATSSVDVPGITQQPLGNQQENSLDVNRVYPYETSVRVRMAFFTFPAAAVCLSVTLSSIIELLFSAMMKSEDFWSLLKFLLLPVCLILSAAVVDNIFTLGLDGMSSPCAAQWRVTFTLAVRVCFDRFTLRGAEWALLLVLEGLPLLVAVTSQFSSDLASRGLLGSLVYRLDAFVKSYFQGGVCAIMILAFMLVVTRIFVHMLLQEDQLQESMRAFFEGIGRLSLLRGQSPVKDPAAWSPTGTASAVQGGEGQSDPRPQQGEVQKPYCGRACIFSGLCGIAVGVALLLSKRFGGNFGVALCFQLGIAILATCALQERLPRVVGRSFWWVFGFYFVMTGGLWIFAESQMWFSSLIDPISIGPTDPSYAQLGFDLPLKINTSAVGRGQGYPLCGNTWGNKDMPQEEQLNILDLAELTRASYALDDKLRSYLHSVFDGTALSGWKLVHAEPVNASSRWIVVDFPQQRTRVVALRGTRGSVDVLADMYMYGGVAVFQLLDKLAPVMQLLGPDAIRILAGTAESIMKQPEFLRRFLEAMHKEKETARAENSALVITGHSLGAALAGIAAAANDVQGVGFSSPGLFYQTRHVTVDLSKLERTFTNILPSGDLVPRVDQQYGSVNWVRCSKDPRTCHRLPKTACELWAKCGDPRGRDFRKTCSEWYTLADINL